MFLLVCLIFAGLGLTLSFSAIYCRVENDTSSEVERIEAILPQTQCGQCGFAGCKPYAEAIAAGKADINQCPPGGETGIQALANLLGVETKPLNTAHGIEKPKCVAFVIEQDCIGCAKCIQVCPVDAILGSTKMMHTVISTECTGCELCITPCPVDCIVMQPVLEPLKDWQKLQLERHYV